MKTIGTKIAEQRKLLKMTQEEIANKLNVSSQAVSKWENDLSIPDLPVLINLADMFNMTLDELIREKKEEVKLIEKPELRKPIEKMMLKIIIQDEGDTVKINLPLMIIKACLDAGKQLPQINGKNVLNDINMDEIMDMINNGVIGSLVDIESSDGSIVKIIVE